MESKECMKCGGPYCPDSGCNTDKEPPMESKLCEYCKMGAPDLCRCVKPYVFNHTPTPWKVDGHGLWVYAEAEKGYMKICDIRGWGYLTGSGGGALGLSEDAALEIQKANAAFIVEACNNYERVRAENEGLREALITAKQTIRTLHGEPVWDLYQQSPEMQKINAALKAAGRK